MSCKFDKNILFEYADGSIEQLERIFLEEHLKYCNECKKELDEILILEEAFQDCGEEMIFPQRLSLISELVAENCIAELEIKNSRGTVQSLYQTYKDINTRMKNSRKISVQNPYNEFIHEGMDKVVSYIKKPVKNYLRNKLEKVKVFHLLKSS